MAANLAVVISSCDLYSDCWKPLFHSIHQYWSDCPYSIYLISNHKDSGDESIRTIKVGEHLGWGSNTKKALAEIHEEYILYLQEDYFLGAPMSTDAVEKHVHFCSDNNVDYIRLEAPYRDNLPIHGNIDYCEDPVAAKYAFSLQPSIWKKDSLHQFCILTAGHFVQKPIIDIDFRNVLVLCRHEFLFNKVLNFLNAQIFPHAFDLIGNFFRTCNHIRIDFPVCFFKRLLHRADNLLLIKCDATAIPFGYCQYPSLLFG